MVFGNQSQAFMSVTKILSVHKLYQQNYAVSLSLLVSEADGKILLSRKDHKNNASINADIISDVTNLVIKRRCLLAQNK